MEDSQDTKDINETPDAEATKDTKEENLEENAPREEIVTTKTIEQKEDDDINIETITEGEETNEDGSTVEKENVQVNNIEVETNEDDECGNENIMMNENEELKEINKERTEVEPLIEVTEEIEVDDGIPSSDIEHLDASTPPPSDNVYPADIIIEENDDEMKMLAFEENDLIEEEDEYPVYDREQLLAQYKETLEERSRIQTLNQQYQTKLAEYFKKKKTDEKAPEIEKNVTDQEQRYLKYMSNLEDLHCSETRQKTSIESQMKELKERCEEKQDKVEEASLAFIKFKSDVAKLAINSRSGKPIPEKDLEQYQISEAKKEQEVIAVRLENIKLKNRLKKREMQLKAKEELAEGLHLIDFEQLKIENQTYNEKIEERNEELLKLRKKITTTVQVLTHLKEKLQFVQGENTEQRINLTDIDVTVAQRRDVLTRMKQARDSLRTDNLKLKHKSGLLGNEPLLRDFEERKDERDELTDKLSKLKEDHMDINMNLNSLRKKIEKSK